MAEILVLSPTLSDNPVYPPWQLAGALVQGGHRAVLAGPCPGAAWTPLATELADAVTLPGQWGGLPGARAAVSLAGTADAIYAFKALPTSFGIGLRVRQARGTPLVLHLDDWDAGFLHGRGSLRRAWWGLRALGNPQGDFWLRWMETQVVRADAVTVSTRALQRRFGGVILRQGVDTNCFAPEHFPRAEARSRLGVDPDQPMVLFLGTPRLHKGLDAMVSDPELASATWFVGAPREGLRAAGVPAVVLERCRVVGSVPFHEAAWYLAACDVFVVPQASTHYTQHQLPAKLLHAMALGCAVVTTAVGDADEILGGEPSAGVVVPPDDPLGLTEAVASLLRDPGRRVALGQEARRRAHAGLGWASMRLTAESVLREVGVRV